jgi:hypothetical protein
MNGKYTFKTAKSPLAQTIKNEMRENRENPAKDRSVEFGVNPKKNNNAPVAISLAFTVGSCCVFYILLFAHAYTNWPKGSKSTQSI